MKKAIHVSLKNTHSPYQERGSHRTELGKSPAEALPTNKRNINILITIEKTYQLKKKT